VTRTPLPARRISRLVDIQFDGRSYTICVGYDEAGQPREAFVDGAKEGSGMRAMLSDACILASIALQYGAKPFELRHSLGMVPAFHDGRETQIRASLIGVLIDALVPITEF
jgi:hypothetical protein